jgi:uncharacterized protein with HEPN domain
VKSDAVYLRHILASCDKILRFCSEGKDAFWRDDRTQDAVIRNFEIIGEAVKRLSDDARRAHPQVPWREIAGFRDVLIHDYMGVKLELVWNAVSDHLPRLRQAVVDLLG